MGRTQGGPLDWAGNTSGNCADTRALFCFGKTKTVTLTPPQTAGKRIYIAFSQSPGIAAANAACQNPKPAGAGTVVALLPLLGPPARSAASLLSPTTTYVRPDGIVVGTGAEIIAGMVRSGAWQSGGGVYDDKQISTGTASISDVPTSAAVTCADWTAQTGSTGVGTAGTTEPFAFWGYNMNQWPCGGTWHFYCVEQ